MTSTQVLWMILIVQWDYNDTHAEWEFHDRGDCVDNLYTMISHDKEQLITAIEERGALRRVYQIVETYSRG